MIETLISSKTRIKLLLKFFLNSNTTAYLRSLESEFGESSNAIRLELNKFEKAGMLASFSEGNKKIFQANTNHPLFKDIQSIVMKQIGIDKIINRIIKKLGKIEHVYLTGDFAKGKDSPIIDLILVGNIDTKYLLKLIEEAEEIINRKIRYLLYASGKFEAKELACFNPRPILLWSKE